MSDISVPCVENHPECIGALKYMLESARYEVMPATTSGQALHLLITLPVDGVLLECDLPDATGICGAGGDEADQASAVIYRRREPDTVSASLF